MLFTTHPNITEAFAHMDRLEAEGKYTFISLMDLTVIYSL